MATKKLEFNTAFKYPFNRPKGMLNILWILLPIVGWFALGGYCVRIIQEFCKGRYKQLPLFNFKSDMKLGFFMFFKAIPFVAVYFIFMILLEFIDPLLGLTRIFTDLFIVPLLSINFLKKEKVSAYFEFRILKAVFNNFGDYCIALLRSIGLGLLFILLWVVLVGLPAGAFTQHMFLSDFYRRRVK